VFQPGYAASAVEVRGRRVEGDAIALRLGEAVREARVPDDAHRDLVGRLVAVERAQALERGVGDGGQSRRRVRRLVGEVDAKVPGLGDVPVVLGTVEVAVRGGAGRLYAEREEEEDDFEEPTQRARRAAGGASARHDPETHHVTPNPRRGMASGK